MTQNAEPSPDADSFNPLLINSYLSKQYGMNVIRLCLVMFVSLILQYLLISGSIAPPFTYELFLIIATGFILLLVTDEEFMVPNFIGMCVIFGIFDLIDFYSQFIFSFVFLIHFAGTMVFSLLTVFFLIFSFSYRRDDEFIENSRDKFQNMTSITLVLAILSMVILVCGYELAILMPERSNTAALLDGIFLLILLFFLPKISKKYKNLTSTVESDLNSEK